MNKMVKFAGITAALAATLLLGGCNEEKKYNALKMEVVPVVEGYKKSTSNWSDGVAKCTERLNKIIEDKKDISNKLEKMKELSKDDVNLSNDYLKVKREAEKIFDIKEGFAKEAIEIAKKSKID